MWQARKRKKKTGARRLDVGVHICFVLCFLAQEGKANSWPPLHTPPPTHQTPQMHPQPRLAEMGKKNKNNKKNNKTAGVVTTCTKHLRCVATCRSGAGEGKGSGAWVSESKSIKAKKHFSMLNRKRKCFLAALWREKNKALASKV